MSRSLARMRLRIVLRRTANRPRLFFPLICVKPVFGRRLSEAGSDQVLVPREHDAPKDSELYSHLKHKEDQKFVGFLKLKRG
jgi:hypothetical protein